MEILYIIPPQEDNELFVALGVLFFFGGIFLCIACIIFDDSPRSCIAGGLIVGGIFMCLLGSTKSDEKLCVRFNDNTPYIEIINNYEIDERITEDVFIIHEIDRE